MTERRQPSRPLPLRVRFRSPAEQGQDEREQGQNPITRPEPTIRPTTDALNLRPEARHIKELLRLSTILREELKLEDALQQVVSAASACSGFRILVVYLIDEATGLLNPIAFAGLSPEHINALRSLPRPVDQLLRLMRSDFRISQSYFISHEFADEFADVLYVTNRSLEGYEPGGWHPDDALIVPLFSPRKKKLLGLLSLDEPEDNKIPTLESIEIAELFANQVAIAIDNARILHERETEQRALDKSITLMLEDLEQLQRGDLRVRVRSTHEKLRPISEAVNVAVDKISEILSSLQMVTQAVDEHTREVQHASDILVHDASQQERQVQHISRIVEEIAATMQQVAERAARLSHVAVEAMDVTLDGQSAVVRAVDGMGQVREATMLSARIMKRLGESGQEISDTVHTMTDLTTRMHLLALNAAIEASRAGEHGEGFSVIAREIRTLAMHSAEEARKVAHHIHSIQHETAAVSQSVEQSTQQVVMQTELVTQTGVSLEAISIVNQQMADLIGSICNAADSQAQTSKLVNSAVDQISQMTSEITEHMRDLQESLSHLAELSEALHSRLVLLRIPDRE